MTVGSAIDNALEEEIGEMSLDMDCSMDNCSEVSAQSPLGKQRLEGIAEIDISVSQVAEGHEVVREPLASLADDRRLVGSSIEAEVAPPKDLESLRSPKDLESLRKAAKDSLLSAWRDGSLRVRRDELQATLKATKENVRERLEVAAKDGSLTKILEA
jgi:hypothetical protein